MSLYHKRNSKISSISAIKRKKNEKTRWVVNSEYINNQYTSLQNNYFIIFSAQFVICVLICLICVHNTFQTYVLKNSELSSFTQRFLTKRRWISRKIVQNYFLYFSESWNLHDISHAILLNTLLKKKNENSFHATKNLSLNKHEIIIWDFWPEFGISN